VECDPAQVLIVNGSQQALDLCGRVLIDVGQTVAIEEPGYPGARNLFLAHGARVETTPLDAEGISTRHLSSRAKAVYVTPSHQFPTGVSMSLSRRLELLAWARTRRAVIIEDDYDSEYRYRGAPLPALQSLAADVPLVYIGTFSKVMFPGLRLGYLVVPPSLERLFVSAKASMDRHTSLLEQVALTDFIAEGHLDRHIRRMRRLYAMRRHVLVDALHHYFGERAMILGDEAGMHLLVKFRDIIGEPDPNACGVRMVGAMKYYHSSRPKGEFVMGFTAVSERALREGVRRLASWREREF
jgi:GntR family transcriptional regulator/MocR family aminotransferase